MTRAERAVALLSCTGPSGGTYYALPPNCDFSNELAGWVYLTWVLYYRSSAAGLLSGRPGYEQREMLGSRFRSALASSTDSAMFGERLGLRLGVRIEALTTDDTNWWRVFRAAHPTLRTLRTGTNVSDVLAAIPLLGDFLRQIDAPSSIPTEEAP